ncbi:hypothetical protein, partial [Haloechinothrix salitolerans]|uniref:hypothetical protein n=1 Tax=Haloechinothrix salitolerans TaxID=926830 RepID=UPI0035E97DF9
MATDRAASARTGTISARTTHRPRDSYRRAIPNPGRQPEHHTESEQLSGLDLSGQLFSGSIHAACCRF